MFGCAEEFLSVSLTDLISEAYVEFSEFDREGTIHPLQGINLAIVCDQASETVYRQVYEPLFCLVL